MRLLVTGGAGFMGSNFIRYIFNKYPNYRIINLDKLTYAGNSENIKDFKSRSNHRFIKGDICNIKLLETIANDIDVIINYAAETHVDRSIHQPLNFLKTDVLGAYNLLDITRRFKIKRFLQISTDEVYGSKTSGQFNENSSFLPNSPYAASKASADLFCRSFYITYKLPVIITHSCNFYGPNQYPEKLIPLAIANALQNKKIPLYGDGLNTREWIYSQDHCKAVDLILHFGKLGETYNISSEEAITNLEVIYDILEYLKKPKSLVCFIQDRPGHDRRYSLDSSKIRRELKFKTDFPFKKGLQLTIDWFANNRSWWTKIIQKKSYRKFYNHQYPTL